MTRGVSINSQPTAQVNVRLYETLESGGRYLDSGTTDSRGDVSIGPVFGGPVDIVILSDTWRHPFSADWFQVEQGVAVEAQRIVSLHRRIRTHGRFFES